MGKGARIPAIGAPGIRTNKVMVFLTNDELAALDEMRVARRCETRGDIFRLYLESDVGRKLLIVDDVFGNIMEAAGRGFGGVIGQIMAEAELFSLQRGLGR
jgi:hypothetical protein